VRSAVMYHYQDAPRHKRGLITQVNTGGKEIRSEATSFSSNQWSEEPSHVRALYRDASGLTRAQMSCSDPPIGPPCVSSIFTKVPGRNVTPVKFVG